MLSLVVVADDLEVVRSSRVALRYAACFRVLATVDGRGSIRRELARLEPDVIVVHELCQRVNFLTRLRDARDAVPHATVVAIARRFDAPTLEEALGAGATAVVPLAMSPMTQGTMLRELATAHVRSPARARMEPSVAHGASAARTSA